MPYTLEAGVDIELLYTNRKMVCQDFLMHNVIEKPKMEVDDILDGKKELHSICMVIPNYFKKFAVVE
jgi:hypothetical protein